MTDTASSRASELLKLRSDIADLEVRQVAYQGGLEKAQQQLKDIFDTHYNVGRTEIANAIEKYASHVYATLQSEIDALDEALKGKKV